LVQLKLERYASGAAQPGIAVNKLEKIHIEIPNMDQQEMFSKFVRQSDKSKFELKESIKKMDGLIKSLIQNENQ
jgi:type I restriction enzyme S subunit